MSNLNELKPIINLNPFARFCCTIGNLPTSYMASLTYEEQLMWFCDYLQNTVIPAVNNNAECVKELQELYVKLKDYVDNYFKNLDVQQEINNKLDEMAEDGTLNRIINQEIFGEINTNITNLSSTLNYDEIKPTVFIGDSYGQPADSWIDKVAHKLGLIGGQTFYKFSKGRHGFSSPGYKWLDLLKNNENVIDDKNKIRRFVVCGGLNDNNYTSNLPSDITEFVNYVITNYPNAHIYLGCIGWSKIENDSTTRLNMQKVLCLYQRAGDLFGLGQKISYLSGVEYIMHNYGLFDDTLTHPTEAGQIFLADAIFNALFGKASYTDSSLSIISNNGITFTKRILDNLGQIRFIGNLTDFSMINTTSLGTINVKICDNIDFFRKVNDLSTFPVDINLIYPSGSKLERGEILIQDDGIYLLFQNRIAEQIRIIGLTCPSQCYNVLNY